MFLERESARIGRDFTQRASQCRAQQRGRVPVEKGLRRIDVEPENFHALVVWHRVDPIRTFELGLRSLAIVVVGELHTANFAARAA